MAAGVGAGVAVAIVLVIAIVVVVIIFLYLLRKRGSNKAKELPQENGADGGLDNPVYTGMHSTILTNYGVFRPSGGS